jgi:hypothetical protein
MDDQWERFRATFRTALATQLEGESDAFKALWSHRPDVSIFGALGGLERGWTEVGSRLNWVSGQVRARDLELENILTVVGTDMAVTADLERMTRIVDGNPVPRVLRCTQVYRIEDGKWRIVHRHADDLRPAARST